MHGNLAARHRRVCGAIDFYSQRVEGRHRQAPKFAGLRLPVQSRLRCFDRAQTSQLGRPRSRGMCVRVCATPLVHHRTTRLPTPAVSPLHAEDFMTAVSVERLRRRCHDVGGTGRALSEDCINLAVKSGYSFLRRTWQRHGSAIYHPRTVQLMYSTWRCYIKVAVRGTCNLLIRGLYPEGIIAVPDRLVSRLQGAFIAMRNWVTTLRTKINVEGTKWYGSQSKAL